MPATPTAPTAADPLTEIVNLPANWQPLGGFDTRTAEALVRICRGRTIKDSMETGAGKTTLLLSHLSERHTVFAMDHKGSLRKTIESPLLKPGVVTTVEGPTQLTLPKHTFPRLQFALFDGPHAYPFPDLEYYHVYPHIDAGGLMLIDNIDIPSIHNLYQFAKADRMWRLLEVVSVTAFFERTDAPTFDPLGGPWRDQGYNARKVVLDRSLKGRLSRLASAVAKVTPGPVRRAVKRVLGKK